MTWPFENDTHKVEKKLATQSLSANKQRNFLAGIIMFIASLLLAFSTILLCNATIDTQIISRVDNTQEILSVILGIAIVLLLTAGIAIKNIMYISILQRTREFAQLRTVGATYRQIKAVIHNERKQLSWKYILGGLLLGFLFNCVLPLKLYLVPSVACTLLSGAFVWFIVFWSFRIMVAIGMLMLLVGLFSLYKYFKKQQFNPESKLFHRAWMMMTPLGFIALLAGWFVTETGRQPWTVYGVIRTAESMSPVAAQQVATTLIGFIVLYVFVFGAGSFYILRLIAQGPKPYEDPSEDQFYEHSVTEGQGRTLSGDKQAADKTKGREGDLDKPADDVDDGGLR